MSKSTGARYTATMNCFVFSSALPILKIVGLDEIDYGADARDAVRLVTSISDFLIIFSIMPMHKTRWSKRPLSTADLLCCGLCDRRT